MAGDGGPDHLGPDGAMGGFNAGGAPAFGDDVQDFAVLEDVDAQGVGPTGIAPGDGVVTSGAAAWLVHTAVDRVPGVVAEVQEGDTAFDLFGGEKFGVDPVDPHGVVLAGGHFHVVLGMGRDDHAALREHDVVVQVLGEALVKTDREIVECRAFGVEIVRADGGGVAARVAAAEPAFLDHGDAFEPVVLGEVIGGGQAMPAAADDDG